MVLLRRLKASVETVQRERFEELKLKQYSQTNTVRDKRTQLISDLMYQVSLQELIIVTESQTTRATMTSMSSQAPIQTSQVKDIIWLW